MNEIAFAIVATVVFIAVIWQMSSSTNQAARLRLRRPQSGDFELAANWLFAQYYRAEFDAQLCDELRKLAHDQPRTPEAINRLVCVDVAVGNYREALRWRDACPTLSEDTVLSQLVRINEAEAMANLGRFHESLAHVAFDPLDRLAQCGAALHCAWVLCDVGQPKDAAARFPTDELLEALPPDFRAEWYLTLSAVRRANGEYAQAQDAVNLAESSAVRASSHRNILFERGLNYAAAGQLRDADEWFSKGASHPYRGQGGSQLLAWASVLERLDRRADAREALRLCIERDPQSWAATHASERLAALPS